MKRKLSVLVAGVAVLSADAQKHVRSRNEQNLKVGGGDEAGPHASAEAADASSPFQRRRDQSSNSLQYLCIYSEFAKGDKCEQLWRDQGHAALMRITTGDDNTPPTVDTWGLWPDLNDDIIDAGLSDVLGGSDVRHNFARDAWSVEKYPYIHCRELDEAQSTELVKAIEMESKRFSGWTPWNNCASFVEAVFEGVMEAVVIPPKPWWHVGVETPCELGGHIRRLNGGRNNLPTDGVPLALLGPAVDGQRRRY